MNLEPLKKDKALAGTDYMSRMVKAMNYSQLTGLDPMAAFDFQEEVSQDVNKMVKNPLVGPQLAKFNPDADDKTDPITGATAKDYSSILGTFVSTAKAAGYNTRSAAELGISSFMKNLDLTVDYISRKTGLEKGGLFKKLHEESLVRGKEYQAAAKEEGIGPITEFLTSVVGGVIPGITDFILDLPVVFPLHGTRGAEKAAVKGDNEFVGMLKGSMERNLMGQIFHAASVLPRTARVPIIGGMFAEQARSGAKEEGMEIGLEDYSKAFLTGSIFGTMGGEGKIGMRDVVREIHNLEKEFPVTIGGSKGGPGEGLLGGERGSLAPKEDMLTGLDRWLSPTAETIKAKGEASMPAGEWLKRVNAWGEKNPHVRDENQWNGITAFLEGKEGEKVSKEDVLEWLEMGKGKWAVREQVAGSTRNEHQILLDWVNQQYPPDVAKGMVEKGDDYIKATLSDVYGEDYDRKLKTFIKKGDLPPDSWASHNIPGGIPGTEKVYTLSLPQSMPNVATSLPDNWSAKYENGKYVIRNEDGRQIRSGTNKDAVLYGAIRDINEGIIRLNADYQSPHFMDKPNVILHFRTQDRLDSKGEKGIVVETIQSDWHQGRGNTTPLVVEDTDGTWMIQVQGELPLRGYKTKDEAETEAADVVGIPNTPPAPFEKTWAEQGLKHALDIAAQDPSIKWVAWPGGKVQNERWGKGENQEIEELPPTPRTEKASEDFYAGRITEEEMNKIVQEEVSKQTGGTSFLETLYDKRLPKFAKKYAEKMGGKYSQDTISGKSNRKQMWEDTELTADQINSGEFGKDMEYPIHRIDLTPAMKSKINTGGQTFYSGLDITKLPEVLRGLAKTGKELFESGKKTKEEWSTAMKDSLGPEWEKVKDQVDEVWAAIEASQADRKSKKPLLTMAVDVDGEIAKAAEGIAGNHGQIPLTESMIKKLEQDPPPPDMVIRNGWVDENGNWFTNAEAVAAKDKGEVDIGVRTEPKPGIPPSPEKGGLDLGPDLTPSEVSSLIESITGNKIDPGTLVKMDPAISKLIKETQKALGPRRLEAIKTTIRRETGQTKVSTILEVKEDAALRDQIRFAARQAKIAFSSAVKLTRITSADYFHAMIERARAKRKQGEETRSMISDLKAIDPATMTDYARTEITGLIEGLDLVKLSSRKTLSLQKTREYLDRNPETELPDHVLDDLARLDKTPIRDLTFDDLKSLHTSVMHLKEMSDKSQHLWDGIQKRKFKEAVDGSLEEMRPPDLIIKEIISTKPSLADKLLSVGDWVRQTLGIRQDSYDLVVETLSGINSTMYRVLYQMVKEGDRSGVIPGKGILGQKLHVQKAHAQFRDDLEATGFFDHPEVKNTDKWLNERVKVKGDKTWELSRGERMAIYMHSLNADNLKSMLESGIGFKRAPESSGIKPNEVIQISEADLNKIVASLSPAEMAFTVPAQKLFERQGMDLDKAFYDLNKYRMELVDNYYPKEVMPLSRGGMDLETEEGMEAFRQFTARVGIDKGMLISRQGSSNPIYINDLMSDVTRSVNRSAAYINLEGPLRNASHLLYDNTFKKNMIDRYGRETWTELEKGLKDISNQYRSWTETEKGIMRLKTNAVSSILSLNPWIWLNQPASLVFYNTYVDAKYILRAGIETASPSGFMGTLDTIKSFSPEMVDRLQGGYDRDIAAAYQQAREKEFYGGGSTLKEKGLTPTRYADMTAIVPGMRAAYLKAMDEFQTGNVSGTVQKALDINPDAIKGWTPEDYEIQAWKFADWVTERTQAQASPEHRSSLSRSSSTLEQVFTSLASQQNAMLGLVRRTQREYKRTGDPEDRDAMVKAYLHVFVVNAAFMIGIDRVRDFLYGREESKSLPQAVIDNAAGLVMFLREVESSVTSHLFKGERGFDVKYPVQRFGEIMGTMAATVNTMVTTKDMKVKKEARNKFMDQSLSLMAIVSGYPYQTPKRIFDAAIGNNPKKKVSNDPDFIDELLD